MNHTTTTIAKSAWRRFDHEMRERAKALSCLDLLEIHGLRKGRGANQQICCPVHSERRPSCSVRARSFKCFSCGAQGDVLDLIGALEDLPQLQDQVSQALAYLGIDYDQERASFIASERGLPQPARSNTPVKPAPVVPASFGLDEQSEGLERSASAPRIWGNMLDRLRLEDAAATYLEERGISRQLARAYGVVSTTYDVWAELVEFAREHVTAEELDRAGVTSARGKAHPFIKESLVFAYHGEELEGMRFRRLSDDETYNNAKYVGLRHGCNQVQAPYLGTRDGKAVGCPGRRGVLWVVEGEIDTLSLRSIGRAAIGSPGAASWRSGWARAWGEYAGVVVVHEDDGEGVDAGEKLWESVRADALAQHGEEWVSKNLRRVRVPRGQGAKDVNEMLVQGTLERWVR